MTKYEFLATYIDQLNGSSRTCMCQMGEALRSSLVLQLQMFLSEKEYDQLRSKEGPFAFMREREGKFNPDALFPLPIKKEDGFLKFPTSNRYNCLQLQDLADGLRKL